MGVRLEEKILRLWMDDRVKDVEGGGKWVFFTQERGGTWVNWDNRFFLWVGEHLILLGVGVVCLVLVAGWGFRRCCFGGGRRRRYKKVDGEGDVDA